MSALRWLYTVVAGFAVVESLRTFALDTQGNVDFRFNGDLVLFLVFMSVVIRFAHGAIRHFYKWYEEERKDLEWYRPLADFFGLFLQPFFFLLMALTLKDHSQFAVYYFFLLAADTLWLCFIPVGKPPYRNWLIANILFLLITIPVFLAFLVPRVPNQDAVLVGFLALATAIHHVLDYVSPGNWHYYFSGVRVPSAVTCIEKRWGDGFVEVGVLLWGIVTLQPLRERVANRWGTR